MLFFCFFYYVFNNNKQKQLDEPTQPTLNYVVLPEKHAIIIHLFIDSLSINNLA